MAHRAPALDGRGSLGRGLGALDVAAAVSADPTMRRERASLGNYVAGTWREPEEAMRRLDDLVRAQGWTSAAARIAREPGILGELRGGTGFFAGRTARAEREGALAGVTAMADSLGRLGTAEARAAGVHRAEVERQMRADATGVPRLSGRAETALAAVAAARDEKTRGEAWRAVQRDGTLAAEVRRFGEAVERRFGAEGMREMASAADRGQTFTSPSVGAAEQPALDRVARLAGALGAGERAGEALAQREAERQGQRRGLRM